MTEITGELSEAVLVLSGTEAKEKKGFFLNLGRLSRVGWR